MMNKINGHQYDAIDNRLTSQPSKAGTHASPYLECATRSTNRQNLTTNPTYFALFKLKINWEQNGNIMNRCIRNSNSHTNHTHTQIIFRLCIYHVRSTYSEYNQRLRRGSNNNLSETSRNHRSKCVWRMTGKCRNYPIFRVDFQLKRIYKLAYTEIIIKNTV